jgi:hypothetical protein
VFWERGTSVSQGPEEVFSPSPLVRGFCRRSGFLFPRIGRRCLFFLALIRGGGCPTPRVFGCRRLFRLGGRSRCARGFSGGLDLRGIRGFTATSTPTAVGDGVLLNGEETILRDFVSEEVGDRFCTSPRGRVFVLSDFLEACLNVNGFGFLSEARTFQVPRSGDDAFVPFRGIADNFLYCGQRDLVKGLVGRSESGPPVCVRIIQHVPEFDDSRIVIVRGSGD